MNIRVVKDSEMPTDLTGGEYTVAKIDIYIDPDLDTRSQELLVIHAVIENYCRNWEHDKVEELCDLIEEGLDRLRDNYEEALPNIS